MNLRTPLLAATVLALAAAAPSHGDDDEARRLREELNRLRIEASQRLEAKDREVRLLRQRLTQAEDHALEAARRHDQERRRQQAEKEALLTQLAGLERENALLRARVASLQPKKEGAQPKRDGEDAFLDRRVTLNFPDTPLTDVVQFLTDITGVNFTLVATVPAGATVSVRLRGLPLRQAMDQICVSARDGEGVACPLTWQVVSGAVQIAKKRGEEQAPAGR